MRDSAGQLDLGRDADDTFAAIDERLAELADTQERCRRAMLISQIAVGIGLALLVYLNLIGSASNAPGLLLAGLASVFGGIVWLGSSRSSRQDASAEIQALESQKDRLIDAVAAEYGWRDVTDTRH